MMNIKANNINSKSVEIVINDNAKVLYSYDIPVAAFLNGKYYKTNSKISSHISKTVNGWADSPELKPQSFFNNFLARI